MTTTQRLAIASPTEGLIVTDNVYQSQTFRGGELWHNISSAFYTGTESTTIADTAVVTSIFGAAADGLSSRTLGANYLVKGRTIRVKAKGTFSTDTTGHSVTITCSLGGTTISSAVAVATPNSITGTFEMEVDIVMRTSGASALVTSVGRLFYDNSGGSDVIGIADAAATIDATTSKVLDVKFNWSGTGVSNSIEIQTITIQAIA
jgi:hypothetical protein